MLSILYGHTQKKKKAQNLGKNRNHVQSSLINSSTSPQDLRYRYLNYNKAINENIYHNTMIKKYVSML